MRILSAQQYTERSEPISLTTAVTIYQPFLQTFQKLLTKPQLSEVATSDLLSNTKIWADHRHCLARNARPLTGAVARPFAGSGHGRDFPYWFGRYVLPYFLSTLSWLGCHCLADQMIYPNLTLFGQESPMQPWMAHNSSAQSEISAVAKIFFTHRLPERTCQNNECTSYHYR